MSFPRLPGKAFLMWNFLSTVLRIHTPNKKVFDATSMTSLRANVFFSYSLVRQPDLPRL